MDAMMPAPDSSSPIRVLIADDHPLLREGIAAVLAEFGHLTLVGQAGNGLEAVDLYRQLRPDVTVMDLQMPVMGGIDAMLAIRAIDGAARLIALTTYKGDVQAGRALRAGAAGYLLKGSLRLDLRDAIDAVHAGRTYISHEVRAEIDAFFGADALSARELEVLALVAQGHANRAVGHQLAIKEETVKAHMSAILVKLGARDRTHAATIAYRRGILEP
jgi:two-component system NarL family response regulator